MQPTRPAQPQRFPRSAREPDKGVASTQTGCSWLPQATGHLRPDAEPHSEHAAPRLAVAVPCSYELPAASTRILAGIVLAAMKSRDRPPEVA